MLGQARGQFLFSEGLKKQIHCITDGEHKMDSSSAEPLSGKFFQSSRDSGDGDCSCAHDLKECCLCTLKKCNGN